MTEISSLAEHGFDHYLSKPFRIDDIIRIVDRFKEERLSA